VKIAQIANFYTPTSGGLRTCVEETGHGYLAAGHERVLVVPGPADADEDTPSGRRIVVRSAPVPGFGGYRVLYNRRKVLALLDALDPDVVEVSDKLSLGWLARWSRRRTVPLVLFSHERLDAVLRSRVPRGFPLRAASNVVNRRLSKLVEQIIVTSKFSAAEFERIGVSKVRLVPLGVDLSTFRPAVPAPPVREGTVNLVLVSRLSREKSPGRAIDALRILREAGVPANLLVIGDGPLRRKLRRNSADLPVTFIGHVSDRATLAELVAASDVALSPSAVESFGLATLEALACGTPVVVPSGGAASHLIAGVGSGVVSDGTAQGLADGVRELLTVPAAQRRAAARAAAEKFTWASTVDALLACYGASDIAASVGSPAP
jgi:alpha-1,6-mannosyltransferase